MSCFHTQPLSFSNQWPMAVVCDIEDHPGGYRQALTEALESGPYGKCVYKTDNNVVDHQVVNMEFENEATASFTMNAFTKDMRRETRICGTRYLFSCRKCNSLEN